MYFIIRPGDPAPIKNVAYSSYEDAKRAAGALGGIVTNFLWLKKSGFVFDEKKIEVIRRKKGKKPYAH